ncbi:hypothetical protein N7462_003483 [Penicillium macrosclerotiorum]|uniref:uncharacterized protein n=1 Tax=Penicillium macrosclerotiorum TaxID=303699 RepID=UPI002546B36C|nr:uncharacterized protein N7462_003483 [Penicillium macrosclerotiorum]KAJ5689091.1 hypothetical protein N7462_003483 [Penicillium macrosclerotiorum]
MAESTPRKRSRAACLSCQSRKRKCSGEQPCSTCAQAGILEQPPLPHVPSASGSAASPASCLLNDTRRLSQSLEANSGAAFVRKLGLRIDPARAPRLHLFAWNVGERRKSPALETSGPTLAPVPPSITNIISQEEMKRLTAIYFEKVDPCYAFLDSKTVNERIAERWAALPLSSVVLPDHHPDDVVLLGIAAFGYLFSRRHISPTELHLVDSARIILERSVLGAEPPTVENVTGWVLRTAYLRMTASPHAAWMASCTLMHLIEAAGLHLETPNSNGLVSSSASGTCQTENVASTTISQATKSPDLRRRIFGMARHLNTWTSFDLGRSRVTLDGALSEIPATHSSHPTARVDLFHLLQLTESLDPTGPVPQDLHTLESTLTSVLNLVYSEPSLILVQCNLMLCIYRRIRALNLNAHPPLSTHQLDHILGLADRSLRAACKMVAATCPWHQVANVPFQVVCTLLAIDNRAALGLLPDAMHTLRTVLTAYDTPVMREAYSTAYLLIAMHQRRKEDDTRALAEVLRANAAAAPEAEMVRPKEAASGTEVEAKPVEGLGPVSEAELSWLEDLVIDMPSLQNFDLDQFLMTDVPWPLPEMGI